MTNEPQENLDAVREHLEQRRGLLNLQKNDPLLRRKMTHESLLDRQRAKNYRVHAYTLSLGGALFLTLLMAATWGLSQLSILPAWAGFNSYVILLLAAVTIVVQRLFLTKVIHPKFKTMATADREYLEALYAKDSHLKEEMRFNTLGAKSLLTFLKAYLQGQGYTFSCRRPAHEMIQGGYQTVVISKGEQHSLYALRWQSDTEVLLTPLTESEKESQRVKEDINV